MPAADRYHQYEILRREDGSLWELGRGAMGITYKAYDTNLRFTVALKVINSAYLESDTAQQRFLREARAATALRHPNVASVFHLGTEQDKYYYVMEFIDGETVEARVKRQGPLEPVEALNIGLQVARALAVAAKQQLVHRDLKPTNLMLVDQEAGQIVKVIDFGLAKVAQDSGEDSGALTMGGFVGTPHFASPEQIEEGAVDIRSDIYSLGVTLYFGLTGQSPFSGSIGQVMSQQLYKPLPIAPLAYLPQSVVSLLQLMTEKDPGKRPQTPQNLQRDILACLEEIRRAPLRSAHSADETTSAFETLDLSSAAEQPLVTGAPPGTPPAPRGPAPGGLEPAKTASPGPPSRRDGAREKFRRSDRVTFSVFSPSVIHPAQQFILEFWAHLLTQTDEVISLARQMDRGRTLGVKTGISVERGTELQLILDVPPLQIENRIETIIWSGGPVNASFIVEAPRNISLGSHTGRISVSASGITVAKVCFSITIEPATSPTETARQKQPTTQRQPRSAFASYSSLDRKDVFGRVQGMRKVSPDLEIFLDVLKLRSGQNWERELRQHIPAKDVFFLFWSTNAARSKEVDKEWRLALEIRGLDYIDPVPLTDPSLARPPKELESLHFNDLYVAYWNARKRHWWAFWRP